MKVVLTIAGSDSSGGAGIQADLKTFEAFGVFGASAITVLTAQNTSGVRSVETLPTEFIKEQIQAVLDDFDVAAIKIGMLYTKEIIEAVGEIISELRVPIVLDPVFISKVGSTLLQNDAVEAMKKLFKSVTLITPNMYEAYELFGYKHAESDSLKKLIASPCPVLIKHQVLELSKGKISIDQLFFRGQRRVFESPNVESRNLHGAGCSYSSAIAANLALGQTLEEAISISKEFIYQAIVHAPNIGHGVGPLNHKAGHKMLFEVFGSLFLQKHESFVLDELFAYEDFEIFQSDATLARLVDFHRRHKFLLQAKDEAIYRKLGKIVGNHEGKEFSELLEEYKYFYTSVISTKSSAAKMRNVLEHMAGFLKNHLTQEEKTLLHQEIEESATKIVSIMVPLKRLKILANKYKVSYLLEQTLLNLYPKELGLETTFQSLK